MRGRYEIFMLSSGLPLSWEVLVSRLRAALCPSGLEEGKYLGHSFRIGVATTATAVGVENSLIRDFGMVEECCLPSLCEGPTGPTSISSKQLSAWCVSIQLGNRGTTSLMYLPASPGYECRLGYECTYIQLVFASGRYVKWKMYGISSQGMTEERECSG